MSLRGWWEGSPKRWPASEIWHLVWLLTLAYGPIFNPEGRAASIAASVAGGVLYVLVHLAGTLRDGPVRRWSPEITTVFALAVIPFNLSGTILFVYAAACAGSYRELRVARIWLFALTAAACLAGVLAPVPMPWNVMVVGPAVVLIWVIGGTTIGERAEERAQAVRTAQAEQLAALTERERISRDLHDVLGQSLTGIVVRAQLAQRLAASDPAAGIAEMAEVEQAARSALAEVRSTVSGVRQTGIEGELEVARIALAAAGVALTVARDPELTVGPAAESALALALREGVTNVVRHARASRCTVSVRQAGDRVLLVVADDGVGGDLREGSGLSGMRERIAALGGEVQRQVPAGTTLTVAVPS